MRIGLIGDFSEKVTGHRALPVALELAARAASVSYKTEWVGTGEVANTNLDRFDAFWCTPGSPYASEEGAIAAICFARQNQKPFLGTCGGFQHAVIEYARNVAGMTNAQHAEEHPGASELVISRLDCSMVNRSECLRFAPGSRLAAIYGVPTSREEYQCNFGLNPSYCERLEAAGLCFSARGESGEIRALELRNHPFFFGTLFQPERSAASGTAHPLVSAFLKAGA